MSPHPSQTDRDAAPVPAPELIPELLLIPYDRDPLSHLAQHLLARHRASLPDLSWTTVLLANPLAALRLRRLLLEQARAIGHGALLGPHIATLSEWLDQHAHIGLSVLPEQAREVVLMEALLEHPQILGQAPPWTLARDLLALFDELTLRCTELPEDLGSFIEMLRHAYGVDEGAMPPLGREASLVFMLWRAWHEQQQAEARMDGTAAYILKLSAALQHVPPGHEIYLAGFYALTGPEREWLQELARMSRVTLVLHGQVGPGEGCPPDAPHPDSPLVELCGQLGLTAPQQDIAVEPSTRFLNTVYSLQGTALAERARGFARECPQSPVKDSLRVLAADDAEQEARAIDLTVRQWLLAGLRNIGVITQDRRLARRLRALLDRAGVALADAAGWALSTTSPAAAIERWLKTVEEDFAHGPLLDLLKSPLVCPDTPRDEHLHAVSRLEQDIILHGNLARGLKSYRRQLRRRQHRLPALTVQAVTALLDRLQRAARPLLRVRKGKRYSPQAFLMALRESLETLGMRESLAREPAGQRVLAELDGLFAGLAGRSLRMSWPEFRAWLGFTLERFDFRPPVVDSPVQLLNLEQTPLGHFDAMVVAGLDRNHLPGAGHSSPFFNDAVRRELGLCTSHDTWNARFYHFRRLLQSAPRVLLTARREQGGEPIVASPWLIRLQVFHQLAYGDDLQDRELRALLAHPESQVIRCDAEELPGPQGHPAPVLAPGLLPQVITASAYQQLMDCPYQFYARQCLGLDLPEQIHEALQKSDYGERVHRCLEAFHQGLPGLPGPFERPLAPGDRAEALAMLESIAQAVFAEDVEQNFMHHGWLKRWLDLLPAYIDWQIAREQEWHVLESEVHKSVTLAPGLSLEGRIDRIEQGPRGIAILDYKTGAPPDQESIDSAEAIQLPCYALLWERSGELAGEQVGKRPVAAAEYLWLDRQGLRKRVGLHGSALEALSQRVGARLVELMQAIGNGMPLPAWGHPDACERCIVSGVCRRQSWPDDPGRPSF